MSKLVIYSHHFTVEPSNANVHRAMMGFVSTMVSYTTRYQRGRGFVPEVSKIWAASVPDRSIVRFHINQYNSFIRHMESEGYSETTFKKLTRNKFEAAPVKFVMNDLFKAYEYQEQYIDYLDAPGKTKVLTLQTGRGKSFIAMMGVLNLGKRAVLVVPAKYVKKWIGDVKEAYGDTCDLTVVQGSKDLRKLLEMANDGVLETDFIIISATTMYNYFKEYAHGDVFTYDVTPENMYKALKVGVRVNDEAHENLHLNYMLDLYSHVDKTISMSATLDSDNSFVNKIYGIMFPENIRPPEMAYNRYVNVHAVMYKLQNPERARYQRQKMYSHTAYEEYIMGNTKLYASYMNMITTIINDTYVKKRIDKQKIIIYAATVELCKALAVRCKILWPHLAVETKVSGDDFDVLETSDILISTVQSTGTAVDIYGLAVVLMTISLSAKQANLQCLGRLRELKDWPGQKPDFYYLVCSDIDKHIDYHIKKKDDIFAGKALTQVVRQTKFII